MLNDVALQGRLVRDPEMRRTGSGVAVCNFTLAVDDDFKDQDGNKVTDFIDCTAWRQSAEFAGKYLRKGAMAAVRGRMKSRKWTDKEGKQRTSWFVLCENVYSCESRREATQEQRDVYGGAGNTSPDAYGTPSSYADTYGQSDFAMLDDDDGNLPF